MRRHTALEDRNAEIATIRVIEAARSDKLRGHAEGRQSWDQAHHDETETAARRRWYVAEVAPRLGTVERATIARALGVSRTYARNLTRGQVPHPRHFKALAALVGIRMLA
jgi:hypothetical protein